MPYPYGNPRRKFLASIFLSASPDYYGFGTSARPSVATAMRRGGDDYNLYSSSGPGSSRFSHSYGMRTGVRPPPPKVNYETEKLYTNRDTESITSAYSATRDLTQSSWAVRAQERQQSYQQRAASADRASSIDRRASSIDRDSSLERWKPVQDIRPSRIYLSSHIFSEPVTLIDNPVTERRFERSSSLAPRMSSVPAYPPKRTWY